MIRYAAEWKRNFFLPQWSRRSGGITDQDNDVQRVAGRTAMEPGLIGRDDSASR